MASGGRRPRKSKFGLRVCFAASVAKRISKLAKEAD